MKFKEAFDLMVRDGKNIKRKSWEGFWHWADGTIWITTREGDTIDIRATTDVSYTIRNILEDDWEVKDSINVPNTGISKTKKPLIIDGCIIESDPYR